MLSKFIGERVDVNVILAAIDQDLKRLEISTLGHRSRLRDAWRRRRYYNIISTSTAGMSTRRSITTPAVNSNSQIQNTINKSPNHSNGSSSFFFPRLEKKDIYYLLYAELDCQRQ